MATSRKPRRPAPAPAKAGGDQPAAAPLSKAAAEFHRFKAARAAAASDAASPPAPGPADVPTMGALPPWAVPPSFALPQPGVVQPAPLAVGPLGQRLGSTLRLGIDVINMALAGSLRLLGGMGYGGYGCEPGYGGGCHGGCGCMTDCCCVFEQDGCCTPSVGNCCD